MHTSFMQLRGLFLAVSPRAEELSISHRGLGEQVLGEARWGGIPQLCSFAGGICMNAPKGRKAQFTRTHQGQMYPDMLSQGLATCIHIDWDRHKKGEGRMRLYRHLLEMCRQGVHATRFLRYVVIHGNTEFFRVGRDL